MSTFIKSLLAAFLIFQFGVALGCKNKAETLTDDSSGSGDGGTTPAPAPVSTAKPFALQLFTKFDGKDYVNQLTFLETGTTTCAATPSSPTPTCTVVVPEGRLYFSSMHYQFSWLASSCRLLIFQPYYYRSSNSAGYVPPGSQDPIDCSATPIPATCWGGAAPGLVDGFPNKTSIIYLPDETDLTTPVSAHLTLDSAYSINALSNRRSVNDLAAGKVGTNFDATDLGGAGDAYLANTYVNYQFMCRDNWYDPDTYVINLYIKDEDSKSGNTVVNDFYTWANVP